MRIKKFMKKRIDQKYLTRTLADLVRINSINPGLSSDGAGETEIAAYVADAMEAAGMEVHLDLLAPGRYNAVGIRKGTGSRSLMWNAHMDTVGVDAMEHPFVAEIRGGRLYGRGSQDMKGSLAAMIAAAHALNDAAVRLNGDLILAAVGDEEYASLGTLDLIGKYTADAAIVTEPTELRLCVAHRGFALFEVETFGRAAHGSRYQEGIDAIIHMGRFLAELEAFGKDLLGRPPHPLVGPPSLHASIIQGGTEIGIYPAHCRLEVERRTSPGETDGQATAELQAILNKLAQQDPQFNAQLRCFLSRPPHEIDRQSEIVQTLERVMGDYLARPPVIGGASFWTDAALLADAGIPSVLLGPTGSGLHSAVEWVELKSCFHLGELLIDSALEFCGTEPA
jgi:acetylornithine deacetylase